MQKTGCPTSALPGALRYPSRQNRDTRQRRAFGPSRRRDLQTRSDSFVQLAKAFCTLQTTPMFQSEHGNRGQKQTHIHEPCLVGAVTREETKKSALRKSRGRSPGSQGGGTYPRARSRTSGREALHAAFGRTARSCEIQVIVSKPPLARAGRACPP
jgi:hypothetical protein